MIYYWFGSEGAVYMLLAYSKGERDDLTPIQKRLLKRLVTEELG